jgi:inosine/xanthosine triphosphatase
MLTPLPARVAVGTRNPVKIAAVRAVLARVAPGASVEGHAVASEVPDQPWGDEETIRGARNRARAALAADAGAQMGVGIEGGVVALDDGGVRSNAWAVIVDRDGREGVGGSLAMPLPPRVARLLRDGMELGHAIDAVAGTENVKHKEGAVGVLTQGLIARQDAYEILLTYALAPWLAPAHFAAGAVDAR